MKTKVMFILTVAILSGCKDVLEMVPIKDLQPESTLTRSINESCDYYWCDGVKYTLTKDDTKSYVVMESAKLRTFAFVVASLTRAS